MRKNRKPAPKAVIWLGEEITNLKNTPNYFHYYEKFQFQNLTAEIGEYVLVSNADSAEPDTEAGCDAAKIMSLYEDKSNNNDPYRAKVQWYTRPSDLPEWCVSHMQNMDFYDREVIEDHRPFNTDVSIETFFKKCHITLTFTKDTCNISTPLHFVCRYRLMTLSRRKAHFEPVLEQERKALELLCTPAKRTPSKATPKTPTSLVKRMSSVSISEERNWSVSKNDGTKLLLKRAILADKNDKSSPKKVTSKNTPKTVTETPKSFKKLSNCDIEELMSMELKENSDDELPTLMIRKHIPVIPKRKQIISKTIDDTPKKILIFEDEEKTTTRSARVKNSINYIEPELSPVKRTPRRAVNKSNSDGDDDFRPTPKTPRTPRTPKLSRTPAKTPKRTVTRRIVSEMTPTLHSRTHSVDDNSDIGKENKLLLGRENQLDEILSFVREKLLSSTSGCMYISGVPGTGKTATVCLALKTLKEEVDLPDFQLVEVNGMRLAEPRQAYVQIYKQLTGKTVVWEQACTLLEKRFTNPGSRRTPTVLLVDELDALCTRRQDVVYSILEWAAHGCALLTVLAVANTMDLPERVLAARVASRLGLTRLAFPPYSHAQLQAIVAARLTSPHVSPDAVQLIARKVAAVSGDARRALALCQRALELARPGRAGLEHVTRALHEAASSATVAAVRACSPAERLMLRAVAAESERTGSDETTLSRALMTAAAIVALDGRPYKSAAHICAPTPSQALAICSRLAAIRLLLLEPKPAEPRLLLNISADDVHYATRQITV